MVITDIKIPNIFPNSLFREHILLISEILLPYTEFLGKRFLTYAS